MKLHPTLKGWSAWDSYFAESLCGACSDAEESSPEVLAKFAAKVADAAIKEREKRLVAESPHEDNDE